MQCHRTNARERAQWRLQRIVESNWPQQSQSCHLTTRTNRYWPLKQRPPTVQSAAGRAKKRSEQKLFVPPCSYRGLNPGTFQAINNKGYVSAWPIRNLGRNPYLRREPKFEFERAVWAYVMFRLKSDAQRTIAEMPKKHMRPIR